MGLESIGGIWIVAGAIACAPVLVVILRWPPLGLSLLIAWDLFLRLVTDNLMVLALGLAGLAVVSLLAAALRGGPDRRLGLGSGSLHILPATLLLLATVFLAVGLLRGNPLRLASGDYFHYAVEIVLIFYVSLAVLQNRKDVDLFVASFAAVTFLYTVGIFALYATGKILGSPAGSLRGDGLYQLNLGLSYPPVHLSFFFCLLLLESRRWRKLMLILLVAMLLAALVLTFKRSAWLAAILAVPCAFFLLRQRGRPSRARWRRPKPVQTVLIIALAVPFGAVGVSRYLEATYGANLLEALASRVEALYVGESISVQGRGRQFMDAGELLLRNPIGYGLGSEFDITNPGQQVLSLSGGAYSREVRDRVHYIHNVFLQYALQIGIVGALVYYSFVFLLLRRIVRAARQRELDPAGRAMVVGCVAASLVLLLEGLATVASNTHYLSLLIAVGYRLGCSPGARGGVSHRLLSDVGERGA